MRRNSAGRKQGIHQKGVAPVTVVARLLALWLLGQSIRSATESVSKRCEHCYSGENVRFGTSRLYADLVLTFLWDTELLLSCTSCAVLLDSFEFHFVNNWKWRVSKDKQSLIEDASLPKAIKCMDFSRFLWAPTPNLPWFATSWLTNQKCGHKSTASWWWTNIFVVFVCLRGAASFGAWRTVCVHTTLCLRPLHPHCAMGGARRKSLHLLCQNWLLCHCHLSHQTLLWGKSTQVSVKVLSEKVPCRPQFNCRQNFPSAKCMKSQPALPLTGWRLRSSTIPPAP